MAPCSRCPSLSSALASVLILLSSSSLRSRLAYASLLLHLSPLLLSVSLPCLTSAFFYPQPYVSLTTTSFRLICFSSHLSLFPSLMTIVLSLDWFESPVTLSARPSAHADGRERRGDPHAGHPPIHDSDSHLSTLLDPDTLCFPSTMPERRAASTWFLVSGMLAT